MTVQKNNISGFKISNKIRRVSIGMTSIAIVSLLNIGILAVGAEENIVNEITDNVGSQTLQVIPESIPVEPIFEESMQVLEEETPEELIFEESLLVPEEEISEEPIFEEPIQVPEVEVPEEPVLEDTIPEWLSSYDYYDEEVTYRVEYHVDYNLAPGVEIVIQEGKNGIYRTFFDETGRYIHSELIEQNINKIVNVGAVESAIVEENEASDYFTNDIQIIDSETGFVITTTQLKGGRYNERINELIQTYNNRFGLALEYGWTQIISTDPYSDIFNGEFVQHQNIEVYVQNNSKTDLREMDFPLIPDWRLDNENKEYLQGTISFYDPRNLLLDYEFSDFTSLDSIIKKGLKLFDEKKYYFESAVSTGQQKFNTYAIDVLLRERLTKELEQVDFKLTYTNNLDEVQSGKVGTKYVYSDGSEKLISDSIDEIQYIDEVVPIKPTIESFVLNKEIFGVGETLILKVTGKTPTTLSHIATTLTGYNGSMFVNSIPENIKYDGLNYIAEIPYTIKPFQSEGYFSLMSLAVVDKNYNINIIYDPNNFDDFSLNVRDATFMGVKEVPFGVEYTVNELEVRDGVNGSKNVYSDGAEEIISGPISAVELYESQLIEVPFETEFTIYSHLTRQGINGIVKRFENGHEVKLKESVNEIRQFDNAIDFIEPVSITIEDFLIPKGEVKVIQKGIRGRKIIFTDSNGEYIDSLIISAPISEIIRIGTLIDPPVADIKVITEHQTKRIEFEVVRRENAELYVDQEVVVVIGKAGVDSSYYEVTYTDGIETDRVHLGTEVTTKPITQVIEYGTKARPVESTETIDVDSIIAFRTKRVENKQLAEGKENILTVGQNGVETTTYEVTYTDGVETSRKQLNSVISVEPITQVIEFGSYVAPVVVTEDLRVEESVPFSTERVENKELPEGTERVANQGQNGIREIIYSVTYENGKEISRKEISSDIITNPVTQIIEFGPTVSPIIPDGDKKVVDPIVVTEKLVTEEVLSFETKRVANLELAVGEERIVTSGVNGSREVVYEVTYTDGIETERVQVSSENITEAINQVVEYGTKEAEKVKSESGSTTPEVIEDESQSSVEVSEESSVESNSQSEPSKAESVDSKKNKLPETGEKVTYSIIGVSLVLIALGAILIFKRKTIK